MGDDPVKTQPRGQSFKQSMNSSFERADSATLGGNFNHSMNSSFARAESATAGSDMGQTVGSDMMQTVGSNVGSNPSPDSSG